MERMTRSIVSIMGAGACTHAGAHYGDDEKYGIMTYHLDTTGKSWDVCGHRIHPNPTRCLQRYHLKNWGDVGQIRQFTPHPPQILEKIHAAS
jgi:hypothetical protein